MKNKYPVLRIRGLIDKFLKSIFGLDVNSSEIKRLNVDHREFSDREEFNYTFKYTIFIKKLKSKSDNQIPEMVEEFLKSKNFVNPTVKFINDFEVGVYRSLDFSVSFTLVKDIKKDLNKFKFISSKKIRTVLNDALNSIF